MTQAQSHVPGDDQLLTPYIRPREAARAIDWYAHGSRQGTMMDPFGVRWMVATHLRDVSAEELSKAAAEFSETGAERGPVEP